MQTSEEPLIGTHEAAEILGVNRATILRWAGKGALPFVRKLPGASGAMLFDSALIRRKAAERVIERTDRRAS